PEHSHGEHGSDKKRNQRPEQLQLLRFPVAKKQFLDYKVQNVSLFPP
ncbi:MAG: hypothetical protein XE08_0805, partial [Parcubacteria bacterium 32_520]